MTARLLVLSDLHISPPGPLATFHAGPALAAFLQENARADTTLVLAGDIVDFLQVEGRAPVLDMPGAPALMRRTLVAHGGIHRRALRDFLASVARDGAFFDESEASAEDRALMDRELPEGSGPRVVIFGHTHAARHIDLGDGRVYINTGTWMDLMKLPELANDAEIQAWIDRLEVDDVERFRKRSYAEVTEDGARLGEWPAA